MNHYQSIGFYLMMLICVVNGSYCTGKLLKDGTNTPTRVASLFAIIVYGYIFVVAWTLVT